MFVGRWTDAPCWGNDADHYNPSGQWARAWKSYSSTGHREVTCLAKASFRLRLNVSVIEKIQAPKYLLVFLGIYRKPSASLQHLLRADMSANKSLDCHHSCIKRIHATACKYVGYRGLLRSTNTLSTRHRFVCKREHLNKVTPNGKIWTVGNTYRYDLLKWN